MVFLRTRSYPHKRPLRIPQCGFTHDNIAQMKSTMDSLKVGVYFTVYLGGENGHRCLYFVNGSQFTLRQVVIESVTQFIINDFENDPPLPDAPRYENVASGEAIMLDAYNNHTDADTNVSIRIYLEELGGSVKNFLILPLTKGAPRECCFEWREPTSVEFEESADIPTIQSFATSA